MAEEKLSHIYKWNYDVMIIYMFVVLISEMTTKIPSLLCASKRNGNFTCANFRFRVLRNLRNFSQICEHLSVLNLFQFKPNPASYTLNSFRVLESEMRILFFFLQNKTAGAGFKSCGCISFFHPHKMTLLIACAILSPPLRTLRTSPPSLHNCTINTVIP